MVEMPETGAAWLMVTLRRWIRRNCGSVAIRFADLDSTVTVANSPRRYATRSGLGSPIFLIATEPQVLLEYFVRRFVDVAGLRI